jgi:prevent-host-death family protein
MRRTEPITETLEISEVQRRLSPLANEVANKEIRVIVAEAGDPIAALVSLDDLDRLIEARRNREARLAVIDRMREAFADVSTEEIEREVDKAVAEVRAEMEAERIAAGREE